MVYHNEIDTEQGDICSQQGYIYKGQEEINNQQDNHEEIDPQQ